MIGALIAKYKTRAAFQALNARDIDAFIDAWADDASFFFPGNLSISGEVHGKAEIRRWFENVLKQYPKFRFDVKRVYVSRLFDVVGSNAVTAEWMNTGVNKDGVAFTYRGVTVIETHFAKATRIRDYIFDQNNLAKAWGEE